MYYLCRSRWLSGRASASGAGGCGIEKWYQWLACLVLSIIRQALTSLLLINITQLTSQHLQKRSPNKIMSVFRPYGRLAVMLNMLSSLNIEITGQPRYSTHQYYTNSDTARFCFGPHFFPKPPFFHFYNMYSSHIEKNLSYRLVNTVEISVNTVVVIIKIGLFRHEVYQKD